MGSVVRFLAGVVALVLLVAVALWVELQPPPPLRAESSDFQLHDVIAVIPGIARWKHSTVTVRQGKITKIELSAGGQENPAHPSPYAGHYLLPGLIDLHTHLPPDNPLQLTPYISLLYLAFGVTSVRDAGDVDGTAVRGARRGIDTGRFPGPRIFACGPFIGGGPPRWRNTVTLRSPEQADAVVAKLNQSHFDCVKAYEDLSVEEIRALVAAGEKYGLPVIGHVPARLAYEQAGVPEVQHFLGVPEPDRLAGDPLLDRLADWQDVDDDRLQRIVEATLQQGIVNTPTLVATQQLLRFSDYESAVRDPTIRLMPPLYRDVLWHPRRGLATHRGVSEPLLARLRDAFEKKKRLLRRLHDVGAPLQIGTDAPAPFVVPGASVHQEMRIFVQAKMTPEEVWAMATWKAGRTLGVPSLGMIESGAPADLLIFREDPTRDLSALDSLAAVIAQGRLYPKSAIDAKLDVYRQHFEEWVVAQVSKAAARLLMPLVLKRDS